MIATALVLFVAGAGAGCDAPIGWEVGDLLSRVERPRLARAPRTPEKPGESEDDRRTRALVASTLGVAPWGLAALGLSALGGALCGVGFAGCGLSTIQSTRSTPGWQPDTPSILVGMAGLAVMVLAMGALPLVGPLPLVFTHARRGGPVAGGLWWLTAALPALLAVAPAVVVALAVTWCFTLLGGCVTSTGCGTGTYAPTTGRDRLLLAVMGGGVGMTLWGAGSAQFAIPAALHAAAAIAGSDLEPDSDDGLETP